MSVVSRNFHFAFPAMTVYFRLPLLRSFSVFLPEPKNQTRPAGPLPEPQSHGLPDFESISRTPPPSTPLCRPDWIRLAAAPIRPAAAKPESAAACWQTAAASDGSLPTIASRSGHALPTGRRSSPAEGKRNTDGDVHGPLGLILGDLASSDAATWIVVPILQAAFRQKKRCDTGHISRKHVGD